MLVGQTLSEPVRAGASLESVHLTEKESLNREQERKKETHTH